MSTALNEYAEDFEVIKEATKRWRAEAKSRDKKINARADYQLDKVESKKRIGKRINYLLEKVRETKAPGEAAPQNIESMLERGVDAVEDGDSVTLERVLGRTRDFLSIDFLEGGLTASRSVGRVVTRLGGGRVKFGTGFLVAPGLLMTNHHVLKTREDAATSVIEFDFQRDILGQALKVQEFALRPDRFFLNDKDFDFALVGVAGGEALSRFGHCPLIRREGKILIGDPINIIQHPRGEMKQIVVRENLLLDLPSKPALEKYAHYAADTEPGSSGSPVFNDQWDVIALHHASVPNTDRQGRLLDKDGNLWVEGRDDPNRLDWIGNEGIRVSRLIAFIEAADLKEDHEKRMRDVLMRAADMPRPKREEASLPIEKPVAPGQQNLVVSGDSLQITVPMTLTVGIRNVMPQTLLRTNETDTEVLFESGKPEPDYRNRKGFDPRFLGASVPLPTPQNTIMRDVVSLDDGGHEVKYHHYSVIMNAKRRLAFVSAVNIDAEAPFQHERKGGDKWYLDPRVGDAQAGNEFYADNPLDRGHLTRRADAAWGRSEHEAKSANDDTFHWTNCAPQHEIYNQSSRAEQRGLLLWGTLENHIATQAESGLRRLSVFNGPIFRDRGAQKDRNHRGLLVPREYWKVVAYKNKSRQLRAVAFVLSQAALIKNLPEEEFEIGPYKPFQVKISEIEARTRLDFGDLYKSDPLERPGAEESFESGTEVVPLESLTDLVL